MKHIKLFEQFVQEQKEINEGKVIGGDERLARPQEIKAKGMDEEQEKVLIKHLSKLSPVYAKYEKVKEAINSLVSKRNAGGDKGWDEYQPKIQELAGVRDDLEKQYSKIIDECAKAADRSRAWVVDHLFVVEKEK